MNCLRNLSFQKETVAKWFEQHHNLWAIYETDKAVKFIDRFTYSALSKTGKMLQKQPPSPTHSN